MLEALRRRRPLRDAQFADTLVETRELQQFMCRQRPARECHSGRGSGHRDVIRGHLDQVTIMLKRNTNARVDLVFRGFGLHPFVCGPFCMSQNIDGTLWKPIELNHVSHEAQLQPASDSPDSHMGSVQAPEMVDPALCAPSWWEVVAAVSATVS